MIKYCKQCNKEFKGRKERPFCSQKCFGISLKGMIPWNKDLKTGIAPWNKGMTGVFSQETLNKMRITKLGTHRTEETKRKIAETMRGGISPMKGKIHSSETKNKISASLKGKTPKNLGVSFGLKGEMNPNWKGGVTSKNTMIRKSDKMKQCRKVVFERDDYRCISCGKRGVELHADHILPFAQFPRLRFDINNMRTLCEMCHRETETWGGGANNFSIQGRPIVHLTQ